MNHILAILGICLAAANAQESKGFTFTQSNENFPNPERGWNVALNTGSSYSGFDKRQQGMSLAFGRIVAGDFRSRPLTQEFLEQFDGFFANARKAGIKVNPRFAYNYTSGGQDAPIETVLGHIRQITPLLVKNKDVLNVLDLGFIGAWGEWHSSTNGLNTAKNEKLILNALLDGLPKDRMAYIRYPFLKRRIFGGDFNATSPWLDSSRAFDGSNLSRVGHLNDCFLSGPTDVGTYQKGWSRAKQIEYIGQESRYTPFGGETCALTAESQCANALAEMERLHINHLHIGFHTSVINRWKSEGCFEEISLRLGYRFALNSATLDTHVPPGGLMNVAFSVKNVGFGELFNPRPVEVVLLGATGTELAAPLSVDPRWWGAGTARTISVKMQIPIGIPEGSYRIALRLPDATESIRKDYRYAIRFANTGGWDAATGSNILASDIRISKSAPGTVHPEFTRFAQAGGPAANLSRTTHAHQQYQVSWLDGKQSVRIQGIPNKRNPIQVEVQDLRGRPVPGTGAYLPIPAEGLLEIPMPALAGGVYFLRIRQGDEAIARRFMTFKSR